VAELRIGALLAISATLALAGCSSVDAAGLETLRQEFIDGGGTCATWTAIDEPRSHGAMLCDSGAKLYLFGSDDERSDFVKTELETNKDIRARTHIMLSGNTWLVIDRIPSIIHLLGTMGKKYGAMIQGRNGANP
jgi:hypothetical protein